MAAAMSLSITRSQKMAVSSQSVISAAHAKVLSTKTETQVSAEDWELELEAVIYLTEFVVNEDVDHELMEHRCGDLSYMCMDDRASTHDVCHEARMCNCYSDMEAFLFYDDDGSPEYTESMNHYFECFDDNLF